MVTVPVLVVFAALHRTRLKRERQQFIRPFGPSRLFSVQARNQGGRQISRHVLSRSRSATREPREREKKGASKVNVIVVPGMRTGLIREKGRERSLPGRNSAFEGSRGDRVVERS